ncbi:C4-dicarboxylate ABC transporter permease [Canicola haemoglobinophilus]|uniref:Sialic acid transporter, TRAP-type C4-dicarboxylate transport system, large permease component n=1 Tax=Canicola haemoglobinophilus TaxID=733 RepID=A0A1V4AZE5_9PAST|nr:TRAP transporter large permease subunit [Canicola haemoglobinophilus]OOR98506.1 C4-dicarboxylate ABC transporter permease [Canicola haemoglobinophilus]STO54479.1 putative sialic acid transporter, TRAP-type C4-dicarboxylate transport system, large permease component [Canicola haemoglobinophilus]STO60051.1 putative sialic acid transporter, TRAP-type C4-dicarboxylate transport system, large permease component [Canicola haemoglobinophilus]STO69013.1 putative sialic acid transporter, TRAP-type C4
MKIINKLEEWIGGVTFLIIFAILLAQIISRQVFHSPLIWSEELAKILFTYVGMLGISMAIRSQQHVYIDFVTNFMSERMRRFANTLAQILIFICIVLFMHLGYKAWDSEFFPLEALKVALGVDELTRKWLYASLPLISCLMLFRFLQAQAENFKNKLSYLPATFFIVSFVIIAAILFIQPDLFKALRIYNYVKFDSSTTVSIVLLVWLFIMFMGTPVGWALFIATILYFAMTRWNTVNSASNKLVDSLDSFTLLSVPFFILTGILMNTGGITERIFDFAKALLGHYTGGMGHVNIGASLIFSGMSGSALADAGGLGQLEIKAMRDAGYDDDICGGITAASCIIGPLVPPSIAMIIYGVIANESIAKLFIAGFVPGVLVTIALMIMNYLVSKKRGYPRTPKASLQERCTAFKKAIWAILTPVLIIGGIFSGLFTPTEAAVIAAAYSIIIGMFVYKELTLKMLFQSCVEAMAITGVTALMVMCVTFFGDMIAREQVAMRIAELFITVADSQITVLIMMNLLLLFLGMFIDALALQFLVLPMLIPIAMHFGIDLVFFGVMTTLNMMIGILTPPMGMALFVVARVGNMSVSTVTKGVLPFLIPIFATLVLITVFPQIITFIPNLLMP